MCLTSFGTKVHGLGAVVVPVWAPFADSRITSSVEGGILNRLLSTAAIPYASLTLVRATGKVSPDKIS